MCRLSKPTAIAAALALAGLVQADESAPLVPVVPVTSHYNNSVGNSDAASQGSVTAELIRNRPAQRTGELLEFVPGMIVTQHSADGKANQYFLRGFNLDHGTDLPASSTACRSICARTSMARATPT